MRFGAWVLAALFLGAFGAHFLLEDRGYVLINFRSYVVEMSVPALVVVLAVGYAAIRGLQRIVRAPRLVGAALAERRVRRAAGQLTRGLMLMTEGDFGRGERLLTQGLKGSDAPLINYLMAARAAQLQGSKDRRNEWLKLAYEDVPEAATTVLLTQAELQFEAGEWERALATLQTVQEKHADHPAALALLGRAHQALGDRAALIELVPRLGRAGVQPHVIDELAADALNALFEAPDTTADRLEALWAKLPAAQKRSPQLLRLRARLLDRLDLGDQAERELRAALKRDWHSETVTAYGEITAADSLKQLRQIESWLKAHSEDATLLMSAARLSMVNELWGKARSYLESSLAIAPRPEAYALYGRLLDRLGERDSAALAYESGLKLSSGEAYRLPALDALPRPTLRPDGPSAE
jgi:HemY protein